jgi:hypothetical protein
LLLKSQDCADGVVYVFELVGYFFFHLVHFDVDQGGDHRGYAALLPLRCDHLFDQVVFDGAVGVAFLEVGGQQGCVFLLRFGGEDNGAGRQSMRNRVQRGFRFPSGVTGPWDLAPLARAAARRASEIGIGFRNLWDIFSSRFQDNSHEKAFLPYYVVSC